MKNFTVYFSTQKGVGGAIPIYAENAESAQVLFEEQFRFWMFLKAVQSW